MSQNVKNLDFFKKKYDNILIYHISLLSTLDCRYMKQKHAKRLLTEEVIYIKAISICAPFTALKY